MRVGSEVICIDDSVPPYQNPYNFTQDFPNWIKKGEKYTIREILDNDGLVTSVLLEEVVNPVRYFLTIDREQEPSFRIERFRELEEAEFSDATTEQLAESL